MPNRYYAAAQPAHAADHAMAITDRTRKFLWGRSGNRCAIDNNELVVDVTPDDDKSVIARMSATSSRHAPKVHAADANIGVCFIIRSPSARLIPGVRCHPFRSE